MIYGVRTNHINEIARSLFRLPVYNTILQGRADFYWVCGGAGQDMAVREQGELYSPGTIQASATCPQGPTSSSLTPPAYSYHEGINPLIS